MPKPIVFISDIHLSESKPEITSVFLKFLDWAAANAQTVYLLGDIFDVWLGDDDNAPFVLNIQQHLKKLSDSGINLYVMRGNRDVMMGKRFAKNINAKLLSDPTVIPLYGKPTLLMHGDTLCTKDVKYLNYRKKMHNPLVRFILLNLPLSLRRKIAAKARMKSREHQAQQTLEIMDVTQEEVERVMAQHGVSDLIHGHVHREAIHNLTLNGASAKRYVLGDWHHEGSVLICDEGGNQLQKFS